MPRGKKTLERSEDRRRALVRSAACLLLLLGLTVCPSCGAGQTGLSDEEAIQLTDEWPDNTYTAQIPAPPGTVEWILAGADLFSAALTDVGSEELAAYLETLQDAGFRVLAQTGNALEDDEAELLLSDGSLGVSLAYDAGQLVLSLTD